MTQFLLLLLLIMLKVLNNDTEVQIAGIKIGDVNKIMISSDGVIINGYIDKKYNIPRGLNYKN